MSAVRISGLYTKEKIWHINCNSKIPSSSTDKENCLSEFKNNENTGVEYQSEFIVN